MRIEKLYLHLLLGVIEIIAMIFFYASKILANNRHRTIPGYIVQCTIDIHHGALNIWSHATSNSFLKQTKTFDENQ